MQKTQYLFPANFKYLIPLFQGILYFESSTRRLVEAEVRADVLGNTKLSRIKRKAI